MLRYHKKVYFPDEKELNDFTDRLNALNWKYTQHCLDNLKYRVINQYALLAYIKELKLNKEDIFEYYKIGNFISKACYRINFNEYDFILVLSANKEIITIYLNSCEDEHLTLNKQLYYQEV